MADNIVGSNKPAGTSEFSDLHLVVHVPDSMTDAELGDLDASQVIYDMFNKLEQAASNLLAEINPAFKLGRTD